MGKYSFEPADETKACKARGSMLRTHFKNTREVAMAIKGMTLPKAQNYLRKVIEHKAAIPFRSTPVELVTTPKLSSTKLLLADGQKNLAPMFLTSSAMLSLTLSQRDLKSKTWSSAMLK